MIIRWNRNESRKFWIVTILFLGFVLSVAAWISSVPDISSAKSKSMHRRHSSIISVNKLQANKKGENEEKPEESAESGGFFGFYGGDKKENKIETEDDKEEESPGVLRSIANRFSKEARKARSEAEREKKLAAMLDKEVEEGGLSLPKFDTSGIFSAFQNVETGLTQAQRKLRSVRAAKEQLTEEEKLLEEMRQRVVAEREKKLQAQRMADQRTVDRRERKIKEFEEKEAKAKEQIELRKRVKNATNGTENADNKEEARVTKRSNPLSVAQKLYSSVFDNKSKEEWIVVAPKTRISPGEIVAITAAGLDLLLVASKDGSALHCIANSCPHLGTPLEAGMMDRRPIEASEAAPSEYSQGPSLLEETDIAKMLTQDGCEDCIVCPLHQTAFALDSGEVRGEWCPYPPVLGKVMGTVKAKTTLPVFDVRTRGKNIEVRLNTPFTENKD
jgi:nitrite reductase/ring-hydroxylating ferredoxin subunit